MNYIEKLKRVSHLKHKEVMNMLEKGLLWLYITSARLLLITLAL